jgi:hypothetical protein
VRNVAFPSGTTATSDRFRSSPVPEREGFGRDGGMVGGRVRKAAGCERGLPMLGRGLRTLESHCNPHGGRRNRALRDDDHPRPSSLGFRLRKERVADGQGTALAAEVLISCRVQDAEILPIRSTNANAHVCRPGRRYPDVVGVRWGMKGGYLVPGCCATAGQSECRTLRYAGESLPCVGRVCATSRA